jgi:hypothetical protein
MIPVLAVFWAQLHMIDVPPDVTCILKGLPVCFAVVALVGRLTSCNIRNLSPSNKADSYFLSFTFSFCPRLGVFGLEVPVVFCQRYNTF